MHKTILWEIKWKKNHINCLLDRKNKMLRNNAEKSLVRIGSILALLAPCTWEDDGLGWLWNRIEYHIFDTVAHLHPDFLDTAHVEGGEACTSWTFRNRTCIELVHPEGFGLTCPIPKTYNKYMQITKYNPILHSIQVQNLYIHGIALGTGWNILICI